MCDTRLRKLLWNAQHVFRASWSEHLVLLVFATGCCVTGAQEECPDVLDPVGNLTLRSNTGNYIQLGWDPPKRQDCVTEYEVCLDQLDEVNGTTHCENVTETFWYASLINIYPCTYYDINVTAYSNVSEPSPGEEIHVHTGPYQVINSCTSSNATDEIYVSWLAPWGESCVTAYNIKWCGGDMYSFRCYLNISGATNVSKDARDYLITGLEPDVYYNVLITALGEDDTASQMIERPQKTCSSDVNDTDIYGCGLYPCQIPGADSKEENLLFPLDEFKYINYLNN